MFEARVELFYSESSYFPHKGMKVAWEGRLAMSLNDSEGGQGKESKLKNEKTRWPWLFGRGVGFRGVRRLRGKEGSE